MKEMWSVILSPIIALLIISLFYPMGTDSASFEKKDLNLKEINSLVQKNDRAKRLLAIALPGFEIDSPLFSMEVTATSYNPVKEQCDSTPLIDSNNKLVMPGTIALPKKFREKIGIKLGQTVLLDGYGLFTVTGHMNNRFKDAPKVDIISFIPKWSKKFGVNTIKMYWWY